MQPRGQNLWKVELRHPIVEALENLERKFWEVEQDRRPAVRVVGNLEKEF